MTQDTATKRTVEYGQGDFERDMKDVVDLCGTWWYESLFYKLYKVDYEVDVDTFRLLNTAGVLVYTIGRNENGEAVSCYVGVKTPYMFNPKVMTVQEIVWCVKKEHRSFIALRNLKKAIESLMEELNIDFWNLNVSNEPKFDSTRMYLEKAGYNLLDKVYSKFKGV